MLEAKSSSGALLHEWLHEASAVRYVALSIFRDDEHHMLLAGKHAKALAGDGAVLYISQEIVVLAWAARVFAQRVVDETINDAHPVDFEAALIPQLSDDPPGCWPFTRTAQNVKPRLRMTLPAVQRVDELLRSVIRIGDGESMAACAARVADLWPYHTNVPSLRALTWAARILGQRCLNGDFGSRMSAEEEAMLAKARDIVQRTHQLPPDLQLTPIPEWQEQLKTVLEELRVSPASDGVEDAFASRKHLQREMTPLVSTLAGDLNGCEIVARVIAMPMTSEEIMKALDVDQNGILDADELEASKIDLTPVYELEKAIEKAGGLPLPALFVNDAELLIKRRRIERALIEGVKELNLPELRGALEDYKAGPELGVPPELVTPAEQVILRLEIEEALESGVAERDRPKLMKAVGQAQADGAPPVTESFVTAAKAMLNKLDGFDACQDAMDAKAVEGLKEAIHHMNEGWWKEEHWYAADKQQLRTYQLAYKRLSVLSELQKHMEPLSVAFLQAALDTAIEVKISDPLVDKAIEILKNIDRETVKAAFQKPLCAGGAHGGESWTNNPQVSDARHSTHMLRGMQPALLTPCHSVAVPCHSQRYEW